MADPEHARAEVCLRGAMIEEQAGVAPQMGRVDFRVRSELWPAPMPVSRPASRASSLETVSRSVSWRDGGVMFALGFALLLFNRTARLVVHAHDLQHVGALAVIDSVRRNRPRVNSSAISKSHFSPLNGARGKHAITSMILASTRSAASGLSCLIC